MQPTSMTLPIAAAFVAASALALSPFASAAPGDYARTEVANFNGHEGVSFVTYVKNGSSSTTCGRAWAFKFDLAKGYRIFPVYGDGGGKRTTVGAMAERVAASGVVPIAGVNADYFDTSTTDAVCGGMVVADSELVYPSTSWHAPESCYLAELGDHNLYFGPFSRTGSFTGNVPKNTYDVLAPGGRKVRNCIRVNYANYPVRGGVVNPVDGSGAITIFPETIGNVQDRNAYPRVLVGIGTNEVGVATNLVLFANDCRRLGWSYNFPDVDAYALMIAEGCNEVGEMDGGGSATLWAESGTDAVFNYSGAGTAHGGYVNRPSDGSPRNVATAVFVLPPDTREPAVAVNRVNTYPDMAEASRAMAPGDVVTMLSSVTAAETRWFSADAATGSASGGRWLQAPAVADGAWQSTPAATNTFAATERRGGTLRFESAVASFRYADAAKREALLASFADDPPLAAFVVAAGEDDGRDCLYGLVRENGALAWRRLAGADFISDDAPFRVAAELDLETAPARVGYLAAPGTAGGGFIRFCDATGSPWFDAPRAASPDAGALSFFGTGAVAALSGASDREGSKAMLFLVK